MGVSDPLAAANPGDNAAGGVSEFDPLHHAHTPLMHHRLVAAHMPAAGIMPTISPLIAHRIMLRAPGCAGLVLLYGSLHDLTCGVLVDALSKRSRAKCRQNERQTKYGCDTYFR